MAANTERNQDSPLVYVDQSHGRYPDLALIRIGKTSANGYLIVRVRQRLDDGHVADITEYDAALPAMPLAAAKKKLEEHVATGK